MYALFLCPEAAHHPNQTIEVYETQGVGKSRTQRITIHYRFVGYIDIPAAPLTSHYISETRQGVAVEYIPA